MVSADRLRLQRHLQALAARVLQSNSARLARRFLNGECIRVFLAGFSCARLHVATAADHCPFDGASGAGDFFDIPRFAAAATGWR